MKNLNNSFSAIYKTGGVIVCLVLFVFNVYSQKKPKVDGIILTSVCSDNPEQFRRWRVHNPNGQEIKIHYDLYKTGIKGKFTCPPA